MIHELKDSGLRRTTNHEFIAQSVVMRRLVNFVDRVAGSRASSFLIRGESGTGKDLVARMLHDHSLRHEEPFLAINCSAIPDTLLESELFGFEKGAFTDARTQKRGLLELADRGTLFLDEIGSIALPLQAKLLRVIENRIFRRLGGLHEVEFDTRIVAATNIDLREAVRVGTFRSDLLYRLNTIQIVIPPLRERTDDIIPLAHFFLDHFNEKFARAIEGLSESARAALLEHNWPGNVRELRNAIEHAMILEDDQHIRVESLPEEIRIAAGSLSLILEGSRATDGMSLIAQERRLLIEALETAAGNQSQAARLLQISRDALRYKMKKFRLHGLFHRTTDSPARRCFQKV